MDWIDVVRRYVPRSARQALQRLVPTQGAKLRYFERRDPRSQIEEGDGDGEAPGFPFRLGIVKNRAFRHTHYVAACQELGVAFRVVDLTAPEWVRTVAESECDAFVAWPDAVSTPVAKLLKDRLDLLEREIGTLVVPTSSERWMYEDKIRLADWLRVTDLPHPKTWVFFDRASAESFASGCSLPVVTKTAFGAAATGVRILRSRREVRKVVRRAFGSGLVTRGHDPRDRQWGRVLFQEFVEVVDEWRLVRIGDAYFGHPKGRAGEFHSGSGRVGWRPPENRHLEFLHAVTETGGFRSMAVDAFELPSGDLVVNELQTVFGASTSVDQMRVDGQAGRMVRDERGAWRFEAGDFARNACANARVLDLIDRYSS